MKRSTLNPPPSTSADFESGLIAALLALAVAGIILLNSLFIHAWIKG